MYIEGTKGINLAVPRKGMVMAMKCPSFKIKLIGNLKIKSLYIVIRNSLVLKIMNMEVSDIS